MRLALSFFGFFAMGSCSVESIYHAKSADVEK